MKDSERVENLTNKHIRNFTQKDTIYIRQKKGDYAYYYFCKFLSYNRGVVEAYVLNVDGKTAGLEIGTIIKVRTTNCYLWGKSKNKKEYPNFPRCHWFKEGYAQ